MLTGFWDYRPKPVEKLRISCGKAVDDCAKLPICPGYVSSLDTLTGRCYNSPRMAPSTYQTLQEVTRCRFSNSRNLCCINYLRSITPQKKGFLRPNKPLQPESVTVCSVPGCGSAARPWSPSAAHTAINADGTAPCLPRSSPQVKHKIHHHPQPPQRPRPQGEPTHEEPNLRRDAAAPHRPA